MKRLAISGDDNVAAGVPEYSWVCNECGAYEYNAGVISEADVNQLACSCCGADEWHMEPEKTEVNSRSRLKRIAIQKGEPPPDFSNETKNDV